MSVTKHLGPAAVAPLLLLSLATLPAQEKQPTVHGVLRVGSWNIEHLGDPKARRGPGEGVEQEPADLARYLRHARLDVLAVQEVTADGPAPEGFPKQFRTNGILTKTLAELNRAPNQAWKQVLFPKMRAADPGQWTGVAWNEKKLTRAGDILQLPVSHHRSKQGSNLWDRNAHALKLSAGAGKTDFLLLVLHLKANTMKVVDNEDDNMVQLRSLASFAAHREEELKDLLSRFPQLDKAFPKERDVVLLGDTNMEKAREEGAALLENVGFRDLNPGLDTHTARGNQPFDRVFVPKDQPEFRASKLTVLTDFQKYEKLSFFEFRKRYSDHYIVVTEVQVMDDDD
jgi:endonuclease/exonuclease/phosphatase family metal-dependent hydrolase